MDDRDQRCFDHRPRPLSDLYEQYAAFMSGVARNVACPIETLSVEEFHDWWARLDTDARDRCSRDFRRGYDRVVADSEQKVSEVCGSFGR